MIEIYQAPAWRWWLGAHPQPCPCLNGPCDGGEDGCGYDPAAWDAWEAVGHAVVDFFVWLFGAAGA